MLYKKVNYSNIIIIISMLLLASLFVSCSGMRPPGFHNSGNINKKSENQQKTKVNNREKVNEKNDNFELSQIQEFEQKIKQNEKNEVNKISKDENLKNTVNNDNIIQSDEVVAGSPIIFENSENDNIKNETNTDYSEKLSTLNIQMDNLQKRQEKSEKNINNLNNDVSDLKKRISEIETKLEQKEKVKPVKSNKQKSGNSFIIKPDEKINDAKKVKISYAKDEPIIENNRDKNRFEAGIKFFNAGKYSFAIKTLKEIENEKVKDLSNPVNYYIAKSYYNIGDYKAALIHLDKIITNSESNYKPESHFLKAECYIKSGRADEAKETYKEFLSIYPANKFTPQARKMLQKL